MPLPHQKQLETESTNIGVGEVIAKLHKPHKHIYVLPQLGYLSRVDELHFSPLSTLSLGQQSPAKIAQKLGVNFSLILF